MGILKIGSGKIQSYGPTASSGECVRLECVGGNHAELMNSGRTPDQLVFGSGCYFSPIKNGEFQPFRTPSSSEAMRQGQLISIAIARKATQAYGAENIASRRLRRHLRDWQANAPSVGNDSHLAIKGRWEAGFRPLGLIGPNEIIGRDGKISNLAMGQIRNAAQNIVWFNTPNGDGERSGYWVIN